MCFLSIPLKMTADSGERDRLFRRNVTGVSDIVTDSEKTLGIGHVRLESMVTLMWKNIRENPKPL